MPTAIAFMISQLHDRTDRQRVERRRNALMAEYSSALGGYPAMSADERTNVQNASELVSLVELGRDRIRTSHEPGDAAALKRLETHADQAVAKLDLDERTEA